MDLLTVVLIGTIAGLVLALVRVTIGRGLDVGTLHDLVKTAESHNRRLEAQTQRLNDQETRIDELAKKQHNHTQRQHNGATARFNR